MEIYCCIRRRIDLVQALHPRAFAFAFGILPRQSFRDPELTIREFKRQAGIINREIAESCAPGILDPLSDCLIQMADAIRILHRN